MSRIVIIDGNSLINRAYYAMQRPMITSEGIYTQGIYGFLNMLNRALEDYEPEYMAVAWDRKAPTFRHKEYEDYKAGRKKMPPELAMELPLAKELLEAMSITNLELDGYEADDIIGTVARRAEEEGLEPLIITGDKDALQLATTKTKVLITKKGISEFDLYDEEKMKERYGLTPRQFIDLKGLMGDQSDNIPGIPGIGEKTGIKLLEQFGSVDQLLERTSEISNEKLRQKVEENANLAIMSKRLATIDRDAPIDFSLEGLKRGEYEKDKLIDILVKLEFNSFLKKMYLGDAPLPEKEVEIEFKSENIKTHIVEEPGDLKELLNLTSQDEIYIHIFSDFSHKEKPTMDGVALLRGEDYYYISTEATLLSKGDGLISALIEFLNGRKPRLSGHDLVDDIYALFCHGLSEVEIAWDTAIAQYVLDPSRSNYELKALSLEYFHKEFPEGSNEGKGKEILIAIRNIKAIQEGKIEEAGLERVLKEAELPLVPVLASMEKEGFRIEKKALEDFGKELKAEINHITNEIYAMAGEEFNINSPKRLGEILFEKLELPAGKKTKSGYSTNAEVLDKLKDMHPIVELILRYRMLSKLNSTYVEGLVPLIADDGKIRAHFQQTVTATGRISCTEPNLQNIPVRNEYGRNLRKIFVPRDDDHILIGADYSQIELRVLAHLSGDEALIEAFNKGADIHRATASRVFGIEYDKVTSMDRNRAKAVNFGVIYGMSGFGLSEELNISRKDAERYIKDYFAKHEKVREYMDGQVSMAKEKGYTETILGRRRYIPEVSSKNFMVRSLGERLAMNSPIQGSAADIIKLAMISVDKELKEKGYESKLILQVHDELIIDTLKSEEEAVSELLIRNMMGAMNLKVELESDLNKGKTWFDLK